MVETARVLVADDDEAFLLSTAELLRREGYHCQCARSCAEAADLLRRSRFDVLIADTRMPGNTELELVRQTSALAKGIPVILVTGHPTVDTAAEALRLPVIRYLVKPVDPPELLKAVSLGVQQSALCCLLEATHSRHEESLRQIGQWMDPARRPRGDDAAVGLSIHSFIQLSLDQIARALLGISSLTRAMATGAPSVHACQLLACPRTQTLFATLKDAIAVLEKTKSAFKSKDLGDLRARLEQVVQRQTAAG